MPESREAAARQRQEAETASVTAEGSETVVGADEAELNACPMTPEAFGPRTPSPPRDDTVPEAEADVQPPEPELPSSPQEDDKMEVDSEEVPPDDDMSEPDCDNLYKSDDSDSDDESSDEFRIGHYMDQLLSDGYIPEGRCRQRTRR